MRRGLFLPALFVLAAWLTAGRAADPASLLPPAARAVDYARDIQPIFAARCFTSASALSASGIVSEA